MLELTKNNIKCPNCNQNLKYLCVYDRFFDDNQEIWNDISIFYCKKCEKDYQIHLKAQISTVNVYNIKER